MRQQDEFNNAEQMSVEDTFIQRWGDMGEVWGINRTMAQIQGLLYITGQTLCTDDVMERLKISRGSASMSLRALVEWGVVRKVHQAGDRRDYYQSLSDVWQIFARVAQRRKRKEIDPIVIALQECRERLEDEQREESPRAKPVSYDRLSKMLDFLSTMETLSERFIGSENDLARAVDLLAQGDSVD